MAKALRILLLLLVSSFLFTVFAVAATEEEEELPHTPLLHPPLPPPPPHHHLSPSPTPTLAPAHPPHHHHHHHPLAPSPAPAPDAKPPTHQHHYPPTPTHAHAKPPTHHQHQHHHHPPSPAPAPVPVPVHPPLHPPAAHPPPPTRRRSFVAVEGVVYIKSCKYAGLDTLSGAFPLFGAVVKLECNNTRYRLVKTGKSDKKGYFYLEAPKSITTFGAHKCKVFLVNAPNGLKPSNLHGGVSGSLLKPHKPFMSHKLPFLLYNVGPFAFEPKCHPH